MQMFGTGIKCSAAPYCVRCHRKSTMLLAAINSWKFSKMDIQTLHFYCVFQISVPRSFQESLTGSPSGPAVFGRNIYIWTVWVRVKGSFSARNFLSHFITGIYYRNGLSPNSTFLRLCATLVSPLEECYLTVQICQSIQIADY